MVHPAVDRDHQQRAGDTGERDREAAHEMCPWREPIPAVDVDPDEDRLHKNEKPSIAKPSPKTLPNVAVNSGHSSPSSKPTERLHLARLQEILLLSGHGGEREVHHVVERRCVSSGAEPRRTLPRPSRRDGDLVDDFLDARRRLRRALSYLLLV